MDGIRRSDAAAERWAETERAYETTAKPVAQSDRALKMGDDTLEQMLAKMPIATYTLHPDAFKNTTFAPKPALTTTATTKVVLAPDAFKGIELAPLVDKMPHADFNDAARSVRAGGYVLHAQMQGTRENARLAFYTAYRVDAKRVEYIVGPDSLETFRTQVDARARGANLAFAGGGPERAYEKESVRATETLAREGMGPAVAQLGHAWNEALHDPVWWGRVGFNAVATVAASGSTQVAEASSAGVAKAVAPASAAISSTIEDFTASQIAAGRGAQEIEQAAKFFAEQGVPPAYWEDTMRGFKSATPEVTTADQSVYRYYSGNNARGFWVTEEKLSDPKNVLALPPSNNADHMKEWILPKGTPVLTGGVAPLFGRPGGGTQIYVPNPNALKEP